MNPQVNPENETTEQQIVNWSDLPVALTTHVERPRSFPVTVTTLHPALLAYVQDTIKTSTYTRYDILSETEAVIR